MKRLLGLLLVMGMVGCGGGDEDPPAGEAALPATPKNEPQANVDEPPVQTVDGSKLVPKDGLFYEGDSETPFTGVLVDKYRNGQKMVELHFKDGKYEGLSTEWHENGQKSHEMTWKDGKLVSETKWDEEGNEK